MSADIRLEAGDCREVLRTLADCSIDSCVTDPPYALVSIVKRFGGKNAAPAQHGKDGLYSRASAGFMGKQWDTGETAFSAEFWAEVFRVLKPGGHVVAFSGTRTYHRMACAIEDAGFEVRDMLAWNYGTGFPKSHNVSKGIDRTNGDKRPVTGSRPAHDMRGGNLMEASQGLARGKMTYDYTSAASAAWDGWGTALKPALEPICLARKPLIGTVAENVLRHGTGALHIDACRIETEETLRDGTGGLWSHYRDGEPSAERRYAEKGSTNFAATPGPRGGDPKGRWPANVLHDGSEEVLEAFPFTESSLPGNIKPSASTANCYGQFNERSLVGHIDSGSAARFFFSAKADSEDRWGSKHPTVKPVDLMRWLARLVTPPGGTLLDPFAGSGTTGIAALAEGFNAILIEREAEYLADIRERLAFYSGDGRHSLSSKNRNAKPTTSVPLLDALGAA